MKKYRFGVYRWYLYSGYFRIGTVEAVDYTTASFVAGQDPAWYGCMIAVDRDLSNLPITVEE